MMGFMCYYGHVQNTSNLGEGNVYKSYFLGALVELPCWSVPIIISKLGRRYSSINNLFNVIKFYLQVAFVSILCHLWYCWRRVWVHIRRVATNTSKCWINR